MFIESRLERLAERLRSRHAIPVRLETWSGRRLDLAPQPTVTIRMRGPSALRYLLRPSLDRLGEGYVEGELEVDGDLRDIVQVAESLSKASGAARCRLGSARRSRHSRSRDRDAISYHYDVSNDFYALWLDRNMVYSCAYFRTGDEDIHAAQEQKLDHVCRKLLLRPGERFLDIGCGWGALVRWAARHYGVQATGITLSRRQYEFARERIGQEGLAGRCQVLLQDYRDVPGEGCFDKVASVGMFEHVGLKNLPVYFAAIHRLLREGGIALNHGITSSDPDSGPVGLGAGEFIDRYVFPDGELPHLSLTIREMAAQGLTVADVETLSAHYARTLWHWANRLEASRARAEALVGARRLRVWRIYLAGCAYAFEKGWIGVQQVLTVKARDTQSWPLPLTREYIYAERGACTVTQDPAAADAP